LWTKLWARKAGIGLAYLLLNMGVMPNTVSKFVVVLSIAGSVLLCINNSVVMLIGAIVLNLFIMFDCVDGTMARTLKRNSYMGEFFDAIGGYTMTAFSMVGAGVAAYYTSVHIPTDDRFLLVLIGALGGVTDIFARLIYQKYTCNEIFANRKIGVTEISRENDTVDRKNWESNIFLFLRLLIDRELGIAGFYPPLLLIGVIFNVLDIIVALYALYHIMAFLLILIVFMRKADALAIKELIHN